MMQNLRDGRIEQEAGQVMAQKKEARRGTSAGLQSAVSSVALHQRLAMYIVISKPSRSSV
ncbi:hypothetical protein VZ52_03675 [Ralstonia mannitolilytica]|nr:hypothetical protein VZ52_03675 [Ralstonia mannitolilytica]